MVASALSFGETRRIKRTETRRVFWKVSEKWALAPLRAVACFKSAKVGYGAVARARWLKVRKRDAETRRTQRSRGLRGGLYGGIDDNTTACRCLVLLLLSQRQLPSDSVFAHKNAKTRSLCTWWLDVRKKRTQRRGGRSGRD